MIHFYNNNKHKHHILLLLSNKINFYLYIFTCRSPNTQLHVKIPVFITQCIIYTVYNAVYNIQCIIYTVYYTVYNIQSLMHTNSFAINDIVNKTR